MPGLSLLPLLANELNVEISELLNGRKMTKEELVDLRKTIDDLIEYQSDQQVRTYKKFNKYNLIGCIALVMC